MFRVYVSVLMGLRVNVFACVVYCVLCYVDGGKPIKRILSYPSSVMHVSYHRSYHGSYPRIECRAVVLSLRGVFLAHY